MEFLWTWSGSFFGYRENDDLWTYTGRHVGQFSNDRIYNKKGICIGVLKNDNRLIGYVNNPRDVGSYRVVDGVEKACGFVPHEPRAAIAPLAKLSALSEQLVPAHSKQVGAYQDFPLPDTFD